MGKTIEYPIGTKREEMTCSVLVLKNDEQVNNVLETHVGWCIMPMVRTVDQETFQPQVIYMLWKPTPDLWTTREYVRVGILLGRDSESKYEIEDHGQYGIIRLKVKQDAASA